MPEHLPVRRVRAVVSQGTRWLGAAPVFTAATPWWADVEPVTRHLDHLLGTSTSVLRLVRVRGGRSPAGGEVTYHVEVDSPPTRPVCWLPVADAERAELETPHPRRAAYAVPGGPAADIAWAAAELGRLGRAPTGAAVQVKTWNLSCVHRIPTSGGPVWVKRVNPWQTVEAVPIAAAATVDPGLVPSVLATDPATGRTLADHAPGDDCWQPSPTTVAAAVDRWFGVQQVLSSGRWRERLLGDGLPDWSVTRMVERLTTQLLDCPDVLGPADRMLLGRLVDDLAARLDRLADTGLPDTVVHGDFQGGNWRSDGRRLVIMDWSDAAISHPALDLDRLLTSLPAGQRPSVLDRWAAHWRAAAPDSDPAAAAALVGPVQPLQSALLYQHFLDHVEPSERPYHEGDPAAMIRIAAERAHLA